MDGELREIWIPRIEIAFVIEDGRAVAMETWNRAQVRGRPERH